MSRARAMEMARPMLVVTNTGSSAQIDAVGDLVDVLPADEAVVRDVMVQPMRGTTPYVRLGNRPWLVLIGLVGAWLLYKRVRKVAV
jgi:apolipoprotein N-acyltransferase